MKWKVITTEREHKRAVKRAMEIFHAEPGTSEDDELGVMLKLKWLTDASDFHG